MEAAQSHPEVDHAAVPTSDQAGAGAILFAWRAHPARQALARTAMAALLVVVIAALAGAAAGNAWWSIPAGVLLLLSLNRFFLPSRFEIDAEGITARYPLRRLRHRWSDLRRFVVDEHGGYLSRRARRSFTDSWSGMHLLFGAERDAAVQQIRARLAQHGGAAWDR